MSQKDVATALGINPATVSHWETSVNRPHPKTLRKALLLMVEARCLARVMPGSVQDADDSAPTQAHGETLGRTLEALDALVDASGDEVEKVLYRLKREMLAVQITKALKGDTRAAHYVSTWSQKFIEEHRKASQRRPAPTPENAAFVRRSRAEDAPPPVPVFQGPAPIEDAPEHLDALIMKSTPEPQEEKPIHDYQGPARGAQPFINASNGDDETYTVRRRSSTWRKSTHLSPRRPEF